MTLNLWICLHIISAGNVVQEVLDAQDGDRETPVCCSADVSEGTTDLQ